MTRKSAKSSPKSEAAVPAVEKFEGFKFTISSTDATGERMIGEICFSSASSAMRWLRESVLPAPGEMQDTSLAGFNSGFKTEAKVKPGSGIRSYDLRIVSG